MPFGADCAIFLNRSVCNDIAKRLAIVAASVLTLECRGSKINA